MYDELIKNLQICAEGERCDKCGKWEVKQNGGRNACEYAICTEAADAIEELQKALDAVNDAHSEGYDVRPLVRGKWERKRYGPWASRLKCSECEMLFDIATDSPSWNFCHNCGAKMEES